MKLTPGVPALVISSLLMFAITGCVPQGPEVPTSSPTSPPATVSETPTSTTTPTPTSTTTPTSTSTPTEPPVALATECSELLKASTLAEIEASNFPLMSAAETVPYIDKIRGEGNLLALFADNGGLLCVTSNGTAAGQIFGYSQIASAEADAQKAQLLDEGFTASEYLGGELYSDTSGRDGVVFEFLFVDGYWFCAISVERLDEVVANSGVAF